MFELSIVLRARTSVDVAADANVSITQPLASCMPVQFESMLKKLYDAQVMTLFVRLSFKL